MVAHQGDVSPMRFANSHLANPRPQVMASSPPLPSPHNPLPSPLLLVIPSSPLPHLANPRPRLPSKPWLPMLTARLGVVNLFNPFWCGD